MLKYISAFAAIAVVTEAVNTNDAKPLRSEDWVNGLNMPWIEMGDDWGATYDANTLKFMYALEKYHHSNATVARQWVHFDADRDITYWNLRGLWQGMPLKFYQDMESQLRAMKD